MHACKYIHIYVYTYLCIKPIIIDNPLCNYVYIIYIYTYVFWHAGFPLPCFFSLPVSVSSLLVTCKAHDLHRFWDIQIPFFRDTSSFLCFCHCRVFFRGLCIVYTYTFLPKKIETKWKEAIHTLLPGFESIAVGFFRPKIAIGDLLYSTRHVFSLFLCPSPVYVRHKHTPYILSAYVHTYFEYRRFETFVKSCPFFVAACVCALCMFDTWPSILLYSKFSESVYSCNR